MRYHLKERAWSLTESFSVRDDSRHEVYEVKGKFIHIGDDLRLFERGSGMELIHIKQRLLTWRPSYDIFRGKQHLARVKERFFHLFRESFVVKGEKGMVYHIQGSLGDWNFDIVDRDKNLLAEVRRNLSFFRDHYTINVAQGVDAPFVIALTVVIERVTHREKEKRDRFIG